MAVGGFTNGDIATALGVSVRTVVNWISRSDPTMPSEAMQDALKRLLPGYADQGDPVEVAIQHAELAQHRRSALVAEYQRLLHEEELERRQLA